MVATWHQLVRVIWVIGTWPSRSEIRETEIRHIQGRHEFRARAYS